VGCEIIEQNIQIDHIHLLLVIPPKYSVSGFKGRKIGIKVGIFTLRLRVE
jgi:REP element-mobilizing transposase RayT